MSERNDAFSIITDIDPLLIVIRDELAGTTTTFIRKEIKKEDGSVDFQYLPDVKKNKFSEPVCNDAAIDFIMRTIKGQIDKRALLGRMSDYECIRKAVMVVSIINDTITLNSRHYGIEDPALWKGTMDNIREQVDTFLQCAKNGNLAIFFEKVIPGAYNYTESIGNGPQRRPGFLGMFSGRQVRNNQDSGNGQGMY